VQMILLHMLKYIVSPKCISSKIVMAIKCRADGICWTFAVKAGFDMLYYSLMLLIYLFIFYFHKHPVYTGTI